MSQINLSRYTKETAPYILITVLTQKKYKTEYDYMTCLPSCTVLAHHVTGRERALFLLLCCRQLFCPHPLPFTAFSLLHLSKSEPYGGIGGVVVLRWSVGLAIERSWVRVSTAHCGVKTLGKFLTPTLVHDG